MSNTEKGALAAIPLVILIACGIAWAGSQGGYTLAGVPIFALGIGLAFLIQWLAFLPAYRMHTEAFYDLTGSLTYITILLVATLLTPEMDLRSWLLAVAITIWAGRLGYFLFTRIRRAGEDRRFRGIKQSFARFLLAWTMQGLWVALTMAAALAAITSRLRVPMDFLAIAGLLTWICGFSIEVIADRQKRDFKTDLAHRDAFIQTGLWSRSRHPNYFGEIVLWIGIAIIALPVLRGWQWVTMISPLFVILLLTRISGIPMLESYADTKWGGQPEFEAYKASTPVLVPKLPLQLPKAAKNTVPVDKRE